MIFEATVLLFKKKEIPFYYFKYLYRKDAIDYKDHLSLGEQRLLQYHPKIHNPEILSVIDNKLFFSLTSKENGIRTPKLLGYNFKSTYTRNNKTYHISDIKTLINFFEDIFEKDKVDAVFVRPPSDYGGKGCFKIEKSNYRKTIEKDFHLLVNKNFVFTEVIKQHESINKIHPNSINTLRIVTLITAKGTVEIISAFMRFGVGDSIVDNASSGGFFVGINIKTGTLQSQGHYLPEFGGEQINKHPDSGYEFKDFKIPFFKEACEATINAVETLPNRFIGWDIAITPKGPLVIESNGQPHLQISNIVTGGLLKNKHVKDLLLEIK